jgi:hypothetical protein
VLSGGGSALWKALRKAEIQPSNQGRQIKIPFAFDLSRIYKAWPDET